MLQGFLPIATLFTMQKSPEFPPVAALRMFVIGFTGHVWLVRGSTFHREFLSRNIVLPFLFLCYAKIVTLLHGDAVPIATSCQAQVQRWPHDVNNMGPHCIGGPKCYDTGPAGADPMALFATHKWGLQSHRISQWPS